MPSKKNFRRPVIEWIIFEDFNAPLKAPLNLIRPVWDLVSGKETLMGRIKRVFSGKFSFIHRFSEDPLRYTGWCINGSALWEQIPPLEKNIVYEENEVPLFFYAENLSREDFFCPERLKNALKNKKPAKAGFWWSGGGLAARLLPAALGLCGFGPALRAFTSLREMSLRRKAAEPAARVAGLTAQPLHAARQPCPFVPR